MIDNVKLVNDYLHKRDWRVKENANVQYTVGGLNNYIVNSVIAKYWLKEIYTPEIADAHSKLDFKIHDAGFFSSYCNGIDLESILVQGINGIRNQTSSSPPKHFVSALNVASTMLILLQAEFAGAQAYSNFDTLMAPYIKLDNLSYDEIYQFMQNFIWVLNYPTRIGAQSVFSNVTFDIEVPNSFKDREPVIGGKIMEFTYGECQYEMDLINRAFVEIMIAGDSEGKGFSYPIPTYSITKDFNWDSEIASLICGMAGKYGIPYFQNLVNSDLNPDDIRAMCCRLQLSKKELLKKGGGFFGAESKTGSVGVVTVNLPRIGYLSATKEEFFERLDSTLILAKESLEIKRKIINECLQQGLYPYTKRYVGSFNTFFSTIGIVGCHEMCMNFLDESIATENGKDFTIEVLDHIRTRLLEFQEQTGNLYNLEQTPAESTAGELARKDRKLYPRIYTSGTKDNPYYTNSCHLPVNHTTNLFEVLEHQDSIVKRFTGGSVVHVYLGESIHDAETAKNLIKKICDNYTIPYFSLSPVYTICSVHGFISGEHPECPKCRDEITELENLKPKE